MLHVQNVCKDYRMGRQTLRVLHEVSLRVRRGELLGIQGPSGAGKSTLLHLMGILDTPTEGRILHGDTDLARLSGRQQAYWRNRLFGFVFQFFHLLPDFTALENVVLPALADLGPLRWFSGKREAMERGRELLDLVGLAERAEHRPGQLSGGERQRVAIARALINEPELLLCDEPTGNMDTQTGATILDLLTQLREETDVTLVIVTHDPQVARRAERNVRMVDGRIVSEQ
jgi:lipoprotein-releasing system ATP-binding protein